MIGLLVPAAIAAVVALVWPLPADRRPRLYVRWWPAALGAFAIELALYNPPVDQHPWAVEIGPWIWVATRLVMIAVALHNAHVRAVVVPAWLVAAAGLSLNTLVIAANNGYMPQSTEAAIQIWGAERVSVQRAQTRLQNVVPIDQHTRLPWLGDVIAQPTWLPRANVISIGDILLALGIAAWTRNSLSPGGERAGVRGAP